MKHHHHHDAFFFKDDLDHPYDEYTLYHPAVIHHDHDDANGFHNNLALNQCTDDECPHRIHDEVQS